MKNNDNLENKKGNQILEVFNNNEKLKNLMLKTLDYAIGSLKKDAKFIPFCFTENEFKESSFTELPRAISEMKDYIANLKNERFAVYAHDGTLGVDPDSKMDFPTRNAIFVYGFDREESEGIILIQIYIPKKESQNFTLIGKSMVQFTSNILNQKSK